MENKKTLKRSASHIKKLWFITMVFFVAQQCHALGMGDIKVDSYLGEPFKAHLALIDMGENYEADLSVRLATPEQYQKSGYPYPYEKKYRFSIVNETGKQAIVRVTSLRPIEDPYLDLILEVSSHNNKVMRTYTVLVDPSPDMMRSQQYVQAIAPQDAVPTPIKPLAIESVSPVAAPKAKSRHVDRPARKSATRARRSEAVPKSQRYISKLERDGQFSNKLSLTLSTSLTISKIDPSVPMSPKEQDDALQEELIAKEKTLKDLNEQIAEMNQVIKVLQGKLSLTVSSGVDAILAASGIVDASNSVESMSSVLATTQVVAVSAPAIAVATTAPVAELDTYAQLINDARNHRASILGGLAVVLLGAAAYYLYRKRKLESGWIPSGLFDDLDHVSAPAPVVPVAAPAPVIESQKVKPVITTSSPVVTKTLDVGSQSMKVPAFKEQKAQPTLPAEFDLMEEANIYLRFGHDKLAEEVLRDALKINASNPDIYISLLGIFDTRGDAKGFEQVAKKLKPLADEATWKQVAAMGKVLDLGNPLYD